VTGVRRYAFALGPLAAAAFCAGVRPVDGRVAGETHADSQHGIAIGFWVRLVTRERAADTTTTPEHA
jgi:hypothetical protein